MAAISESEWALWRSFFLMRRQLDHALGRRLQQNADISAPEYELLFALSEAPGKQLRARELAEVVGWEKSRVSHQVTRMATRGLVEKRDCDSDGRGVWVTLTADGRRAVLGAMRDHTEAMRSYVLDVLSDEDKAILARISTTVLDAINPPVCEALTDGSDED